MKRKTTLILSLLTAMTIATALRADESPGAFPLEKVAEFEDFLKRIATSPPLFGDPPKATRILNHVQERGMPKDLYIAAVEKVAEALIADTFIHTNYSGKTEIRFKWGLAPFNLVNYMGDLGDSEFLPWLEQQVTESERSGIRERAAISYVRIAGLDAVPFVRKILSGSDETYAFGCKAGVAKHFFDQIVRAESAKAPQDKIDAAYKMLVEQVQIERNEHIAWELDKRLSLHLPEYKTSIQRNRVLSNFLQTTNETARGLFTQRFNELQQAARAERTDLSVRFPGLMVMQNENEEREQIISITEDE